MKAFTLLELLIALILTSFIVVTVIFIVLLLNKQLKSNQAEFAQFESWLSMEQVLDRDLDHCRHVSITANALKLDGSPGIQYTFETGQVFRITNHEKDPVFNAGNGSLVFDYFSKTGKKNTPDSSLVFRVRLFDGDGKIQFSFLTRKTFYPFDRMEVK